MSLAVPFAPSCVLSLAASPPGLPTYNSRVVYGLEDALLRCKFTKAQSRNICIMAAVTRSREFNAQGCFQTASDLIDSTYTLEDSLLEGAGKINREWARALASLLACLAVRDGEGTKKIAQRLQSKIFRYEELDTLTMSERLERPKLKGFGTWERYQASRDLTTKLLRFIAAEEDLSLKDD